MSEKHQNDKKTPDLNKVSALSATSLNKPRKRGILTTGLTRDLLIRLLLLSIIPLLIVVWVSFQNSVQTIMSDRTSGLTAIVQAKHDHISDYFATSISNLQLLAETENTVNFLESLTLQYQKSERSLKKFTMGYQWSELEDQFGSDFSLYLTSHNHIDIMLLDDRGNVLYSIRRDSDLGTNVFNSEYSDSKLTKAIRRTIERGKVSYSDMMRYPPYDNNLASFLVQSVVNDFGDKIGVVVVHLSFDPIKKIMESRSLKGFGQTGEVYLVGTDLLMRSNSRFIEHSRLETSVNTEPVLLWLNTLSEENERSSENELAQLIETYKGYRGTPVIGEAVAVKYADTSMLMIAEVDEKEALAPVRIMIEEAIWVVAITIFIVLIISIYIARKITNPIVELTTWAKELSEGSLEKKEIDAPNNEIGILNNTFNEMVSSLQAVSAWIAEFSVGDLTNTLKKRSEDDILVVNLNQLHAAMQSVVGQADLIANGDFESDVTPRSENDVLGLSLQKMTLNLREAKTNNELDNWLKTSQTELADEMRGDKDVSVLCHVVLTYIANSIDAHVGSIYVVESEQNSELLTLLATYAHDGDRPPKTNLSFGEGLVGQAALEKGVKVLKDLPPDYLKVSSSLGRLSANNVLLLRLENNNKVIGVIELGSVKSFSDRQIAFLQASAESIAIAIETSLNRRVTNVLLEKTRQQSQALLTANENLEEHTQQLKRSEQILKQQGEELRVSNEELEEKQELLQKQKLAVENAKKDLESKAEELEQASKYKSEFLANMSHELRTPLNSLLILSKSLASNRTGNLTKAQQEDAQIIYDGGNDLLELINDIMDLSKVEAGMLSLTIEKVNLENVAKNTETLFGRAASEKGLEFRVSISTSLEGYIYSDGQRLQQIIKNFISNALKFTKSGFVGIDFHPISKNTMLRKGGLDFGTGIGISVIDSGIGIPVEKQKAIFDAFQQEDGSTSREFGGTGLGLAISRELANLLGGEIHLSSEKGKGSTFTLYIPKQWDKEVHAQAENLGHITFVEEEELSASLVTIKSQTPKVSAKRAPMSSAKMSESNQWLADDRRNILPEDNVLLIIEDDPAFAKILLRIGKEHHHKVILTNHGRDGMLLALEYKPNGILLDMGLPDINGLEVLDQLKFNLETREIPVHAISANDYTKPSLARGALSFQTKPASEEDIINALKELDAVALTDLKSILVVEDDTNGQKAIARLLENLDTSISFASSLNEASSQLESASFDCIILDLGLPDSEGSEVLEKVSSYVAGKHTPIIVYTGQEISDELHKTLKEYSSSIIIKGSESPERLLDDVSLFLHRVGKQLPDHHEQKIKMLHNQDAMLSGRKVLLVDDDMRNVFALKRLLDEVGLIVTPAENGQVAVDQARDASDEPFELILMDIMMPIKDGYQAMKEIRQLPDYADTPIMALTAKAMPEDRQKCIDAGASDYITKPIDTDKLLSMIRVWLYKKV